MTYVSSDGAFGGPVAVADTQTRELARRGHDVHLLAGWDGIAHLEIPDVNVKLFPASGPSSLGFSGLLSPALIRYLRVNASTYDVVHVHAGRHAISLLAARAADKADIPFVLQTHGMVMPDNRIKSRLFDSLGLRRLMTRAASVLALTAAEASGLAAVAPINDRVQRIRNGIESAPRFARPDASEGRPEVLFLARLHPRKRVMAFAKMALLMTQAGVDAEFSVIGPDEGDLSALKSFIKEHKLTNLKYEGTIAPGTAQERLSRADVFVLPSTGEVFPMTVLEAISVRTPTVLTSDCGISAELEEQGAALVTDGTPAELARAVSALFTDVTVRSDLELGMGRAMSETFGISAVAERLEEIYQSAIAMAGSDTKFQPRTDVA